MARRQERVGGKTKVKHHGIASRTNVVKLHSRVWRAYVLVLSALLDF
jgi:hypothetical protein